jgi:hypothetical protein
MGDRICSRVICLRYICPMRTDRGVERLRAEQRGGRWWVAGPASDGSGLVMVNDFLGYLADRGYSPRTVRSYAYDLLAFLRWLETSGSRSTRLVPRGYCGS